MLFRLEDGKDFFELNPEAKAIKEFSERTSQQMWFVALVADYGSPLRQLPEKKKKEKAAEIAGYGKEASGRGDKNYRNLVDGKVPTVEAAIQKYNDIQYDEDADMIEAINRQIQEAIYFSKLDKEEACTIETVRTFRDGSTEKTRRIDTAAMSKLASDASKMTKGLPELRAKKKEIMSQMIAGGKLPTNVTTYTAADIAPEQGEEENTQLSTLDQFMSKKAE